MGQSIAIKGLSRIDILKNFEKNLKELTGLEIAYLDVRNNPVLPPGQYYPLFKVIARIDKKERFLSPIQEACRFVKNNKKPRVFCFSSMVQAAMPIIANDEVIGIALTAPAKDDACQQDLPDLIQKRKASKKLVKLWKELPALKKQELDNWSKMLFGMLNYIFKHEYDFLVFSDADDQITRTQESLRNAIAFIKDNYHQKDISLAAVAKEVCLSHYYFSHLFKRELKISFIDHLTKVRLEAATKLLRNLKLNVNQIAYAVGYQDPNYFSKVFKRNYKISPLEYRSRIFKRQTQEKTKKYSRKTK